MRPSCQTLSMTKMTEQYALCVVDFFAIRHILVQTLFFLWSQVDGIKYFSSYLSIAKVLGVEVFKQVSREWTKCLFISKLAASNYFPPSRSERLSAIIFKLAIGWVVGWNTNPAPFSASLRSSSGKRIGDPQYNDSFNHSPYGYMSEEPSLFST